MNCLVLLSILLCCGGNNRSCSGRENFPGDNSEKGKGDKTVCNIERCNTENRMTINTNAEKNEECDRMVGGRNSDMYSNVHSCPTPPMSRTKFPYLDTEPRTCGCEEVQEN